MSKPSTKTIDKVRDLYQARPYPLPNDNLDAYRDKRMVPRGTPSSCFHLYWPTKPQTGALDMLVAGCGTSQAVEYALWEPEARIVATDISQPSLDHTQKLIDKYGIKNIELQLLSIEDIGKLKRDFDYIACTGVLHHMDDPAAGLRSLRGVLRKDGIAYLMVYGKYGRLGVYLFQDYCKRLGIEPTDEGLAELAKVFRQMPNNHPLMPMYQRLNDFKSPNGIADMFLHPRDRAYTVPDIYDWLKDAGMSFQRWLHQAIYLPECNAVSRTAHLEKIKQLPEAEQYAAVELFRGNINKHFVIACRDDRPEDSYRIRFDNDDWRNYVPMRTANGAVQRTNDRPDIAGKLVCSAHDPYVLRPGLPPVSVHLYQLMDQKRTLGEIAAASRLPDDMKDDRTRDLFETLWKYDQVAFHIKRRRARRAT